MRSSGSTRVQRSLAPGSQNVQGEAGGLAGVLHVGAGTRQASWLGGPEAGAHAQTDPSLETGLLATWWMCRSCIGTCCTQHPWACAEVSPPSVQVLAYLLRLWEMESQYRLMVSEAAWEDGGSLS